MSIYVLECKKCNREFRHHDNEEYEGKEENMPSLCPDCRHPEKCKTNPKKICNNCFECCKCRLNKNIICKSCGKCLKKKVK